MHQQLQWARGKPEESSALSEAAWAAMVRGKLVEATRLFVEAKRITLQNNSPAAASDVQLEQANLEADLGLAGAARKDVQEALSVSNQSAFELAWSARALARSGELNRAQDLAKQATSKAPLDTIVNAALLASAQAAVDLGRHDGNAAVAALEVTRPYDFCNAMEMSPGYYRGLAYVENGQLDKAVLEFENVIEHASVADFPVYVTLAKLEVGHTFQLLGKDALAAQIFVELNRTWKDADLDFPPLKRLHAYERRRSFQM